MDLAKVTMETLELLKMVLPIMFFGILLSNIAFSLPVVRRLVEPLDRLTSAVGIRCGKVIFAFLAHPIAGLSVLSDLYRRGNLGEEEVTLIYLLSLIPRNLRIVLIFLAPVAVSALGLWLGIAYVLLELASRLAVVFLAIAVFRRNFGSRVVDYDSEDEFDLKESVKNALKMFLKTVSVFVPSVFAVMLLLDLGLLNAINGACSSFLSSSSIVVVAAGTASMIAGIGVAGSLLSKGMMDPITALTSLFLASTFHGFVEFLRRSVPLNVSFFGRLGIRLALLNLLLRECACLLVLSILIALGR